MEGDAESGFTITNAYTPETTEISATKEWDDADNQDGKRDDVTFNLLADGAVVSGQEKTISKTATGDDLTVTWTDLPVYADGEEIAYTVEEAGVTDGKITMNGAEYTVTVEGDAESGFTITNTHTPVKTKVTVTKVWSDSNNQDGIRPASISMQLSADGKASGEAVTLNAGNSWTYTWENLDVNTGGKAIKYTVDETAVPTGYTKTVGAVTGDADSGFKVTITNSHTPTPPPPPDPPPWGPPVVPPAEIEDDDVPLAGLGTVNQVGDCYE